MIMTKELNIEQERPAFEAWQSTGDADLERAFEDPQFYADRETNCEWHAWLAAKRAAMGSAEPVAHLRYRCSQQWDGNGNNDIQHHEGYEVCESEEKGDDGNPAFPVYTAPPAPVSAEPVKVNVHHVKLKSRSEMEKTIPRERLGWWHDVCPGDNLVMRDATASDLARCSLKSGADRKPENYLCELPENGSLVHRDAIKNCRTIAIVAPPSADAKDSERLAHILKHAVQGGSYFDVTSLNVLVSLKTLQTLGPLAAIDEAIADKEGK
jgi:hypothetical protein